MNDKVVPFRPAPATGLSDNLMRLLSDPGITAEKMQLVLQMQKDIAADMRREAFASAFAAMSPKLPKIEKRGKVELIKADGKKAGSYAYAKYEDMDDLVRPILFEHGFSLLFYPGLEDGKPVLYGELIHVVGHSKRGFLPLMPDRGPGRNDLQAEGSGLSYQKRYLCELLLNIVRKGVDDDGIAGGLKPIEKAHVAELRQLLADVKTKEEAFLKLFVTDVESLEQIAERDYPRLKNALEQKKAALSKNTGKKNGAS